MYLPSEKRTLEFMIEQKLMDKGDVVINPESSDIEFFSALTDMCTLNKLRDANNGT